MCCVCAGTQTTGDVDRFTDLDGRRDLCLQCILRRARATPVPRPPDGSSRERCRGCIGPLSSPPVTLITADPFITDLRCLLLKRIDQVESTKSVVKVTVPNWVQPSVEGFINVLRRISHGSAEDPAWDRMPMGCDLLWSDIPIPGSDRRLRKKSWTITTMRGINEVAKLHSISETKPDGTSKVGYGPIVIKSGGKVLSLVPPMTICSYAQQKGSSWRHVVDVSCPIVSIPNAKKSDLQFSEEHRTDVSFESADVNTWPLLPPYDDYSKYLKKTLPQYVSGAHEYYKDNENAPKVPKRVQKLATMWLRVEKVAAPGFSDHPYYMSPRLDKRKCGTIEPDCLRMKREHNEQERKRKREAKEREKAERARERGFKRSQREGPARRFR